MVELYTYERNSRGSTRKFNSRNPPRRTYQEKEASFLARVLGFVVGRKQAEVTEQDVKNLAERVKQLGPEAADETIDAAISAYREEMVRRDQAKKPPVEPEQS